MVDTLIEETQRWFYSFIFITLIGDRFAITDVECIKSCQIFQMTQGHICDFYDFSKRIEYESTDIKNSWQESLNTVLSRKCKKRRWRRVRWDKHSNPLSVRSIRSLRSNSSSSVNFAKWTIPASVTFLHSLWVLTSWWVLCVKERERDRKCIYHI